jgi:hypothetical protein
MKKILILLCACIVLVGCQSTPQKPPETIAIESVYNIDKNLVSDSKTIAEVVSKAESISLAGCPANFVKAYQANISARNGKCRKKNVCFGQHIKSFERHTTFPQRL